MDQLHNDLKSRAIVQTLLAEYLVTGFSCFLLWTTLPDGRQINHLGGCGFVMEAQSSLRMHHPLSLDNSADLKAQLVCLGRIKVDLRFDGAILEYKRSGPDHISDLGQGCGFHSHNA